MPDYDIENAYAEAWDIDTHRPLYTQDEYWDLLRYRVMHRKHRPIDCVCGAMLRYMYGEYVHYHNGEYTRRCPSLDLGGRL